MENKNKWLPYFNDSELKCKCGSCSSVGNEMDDSFMSAIVEMRKELQIPFFITSAYRCKSHNNKVSSSGLDGPHTTGKAIDIRCRGISAWKILDCAFSYEMKGIGVSQKGDVRFIHLDNCDETKKRPRPTVWSY